MGLIVFICIIGVILAFDIGVCVSGMIGLIPIGLSFFPSIATIGASISFLIDFFLINLRANNLANKYSNIIREYIKNDKHLDIGNVLYGEYTFSIDPPIFINFIVGIIFDVGMGIFFSFAIIDHNYLYLAEYAIFVFSFSLIHAFAGKYEFVFFNDIVAAIHWSQMKPLLSIPESFSMMIFKGIQKSLKEKILNVSIFKKHLT